MGKELNAGTYASSTINIMRRLVANNNPVTISVYREILMKRTGWSESFIKYLVSGAV